MKFKTDENLPVEAAELLRSVGFDALSVHEQRLSGTKDAQLAIVCLDEDRALVTLDWDFADIRTYPPDEHAGIIVLRPSTQAKRHIISLIHKIVPLLAVEVLRGRLWLVDEKRIRIRGEG